jgi:hypothetical protein
MKKRSQEQPTSDSSIDSLEESRAKLRSIQQLVCHLLSREPTTANGIIRFE